MSWQSFCAGFFRDPITRDGSSTRLSGLLCAVAGCAVGVIGAATKYDTALIVGALLGGGSLHFFSRTKGAAGGEQDTPGEP